MYSDPISVNYDGAGAKNLVRVGSQSPERLGRFTSADGNYEVAVRQDKTNARFRREIRITMKKVSADPISAVNKEVSASVIIAIDEPRWGFSDTDLKTLYDGLSGFAGNATNFGKLVQGEL